MNVVEREKEKYKTAVKQLSKLSPDMAQGFPDEPGLEILGRGLEYGKSEEAIPHSLPEKKSGSGPNKRMRGLGRVFQPTYKDKKTNEQKQAATWWVQYSYRGRVKREASGSLHRADAVRLLKKRLAEIGKGRLIGPDIEKTTFEDLAGMLLNDYRANGRRSLNRVDDAVTHLRGTFGGMLALDITSDKITAHKTDRQQGGAANATINRELSALKRMFRLGELAGKVAQRPHFEMLKESNVRKGFFEADQFRSVLVHLSEDLQPAIRTAYITGWRIHDEILTRRRHHVDLQAGWIRLEPGETKNGEGRMFFLTPELHEILERQRVRTEALERATGQIIPWIFHRDGKPIKSFRRSWKTACKRAGIPGRIPHDFRRTAVRNLERAGVNRSTAMKMVGHRTESIYRRYAIVDETMLREGAEKLSTFHESERRNRQNKAAGEK